LLAIFDDVMHVAEDLDLPGIVANDGVVRAVDP
jgi:hypothetical protein